MQTTLLGFAIAIILALVAALVGPFSSIGQVSRRVRGQGEPPDRSRLPRHGAIDARLLPTPTLMLQALSSVVERGSKARALTHRVCARGLGAGRVAHHRCSARGTGAHGRA